MSNPEKIREDLVWTDANIRKHPLVTGINPYLSKPFRSIKCCYDGKCSEFATTKRTDETRQLCEIHKKIVYRYNLIAGALPNQEVKKLGRVAVHDDGTIVKCPSSASTIGDQSLEYPNVFFCT